MKPVRLFITILALCVVTNAQSSINSAKPEENARIKPLVAEMTKALETFNAKRDKLPEAKALDAAKAAYDKALETAKVTYDKALEALNKAAESFPEREAVKAAEAKVLDEIYRIQAAHNLSSREYKPVINEKGELAFAKIEPAKP